MKIIETYHHDGDQTYYWSTIEEAIKSGRFDYLHDMWDNDEYEGFDDYINSCSELREFIEGLEDCIFYIEE